MDIIFNEAFSEGFFIAGTLIVVAMTWIGYRREKYSSFISMLVVAVFVSYLIAFFYYRYATGHMAAHMASEPSYIALAIGHGLISLAAIVMACVVFIIAERSFKRGENYFRLHEKTSLILVVLWPLALLSGFLLG